MKRLLAAAAVFLPLAAAACRPAPERVAPAGTVIDSVRPIEAKLAAFRAGVGGGEVRELRSAATSLEALVAEFAAAVAARDTAGLRRLVLDAREFAWLYYPYTVYTHPPYRQAPGVVWLLTGQNSEKGLRRLLERYGGRPLAPAEYRCQRTEPQDLNRLHLDCRVVLAGDPVPRRLFGTVIERNGRFKFVSLANEL